MASIFKREWTTKAGAAKVAWQVQYLVKGKKHRRQFPTERKARKFAETVSIHRDATEKQIAVFNSPKFEEVCWAWLNVREKGLDGNPPIDPETVVWYRGLLTNHILPELGQLRALEIGRTHIRNFRHTLLDRGTLSRRSVKKVLTTLGSVFRHAVEAEIVPVDPTVGGLSVRESSRERKEIAVHTPDEMRAILHAALSMKNRYSKRSNSNWAQYYPFLMLLVYTGMRLSEARGLDCKDVNLAAGTIHVRQRADRRGRLGAPKSRQGHREIHIPDVLVAALGTVIDAQHDGLVFRTKSGRPIDPVNFKKRCWEKVQVAAGVPVKTLHSVRHFFATRQIAHGVNPKELAGLLGHADEAFTLRVYGHLFKDRDSQEKRKKRAEALVLTA